MSDHIKVVRAKLVEREIHNWSTSFSFSSDDCKCFSPEILSHNISTLSKESDPVGLKFVVCRENDFDALIDVCDLLEKAIPLLQKNARDNCACVSGDVKNPCEHCKLSYESAVALFMATGRSLDREDEQDAHQPTNGEDKDKGFPDTGNGLE